MPMAQLKDCTRCGQQKWFCHHSQTVCSDCNYAYLKSPAHKARAKIWKSVKAAIKAGELVRQPCEVCSSTKFVDAHHDDDSKPLSVRWLCRAHHRQHHVNVKRLTATNGANPS